MRVVLVVLFALALGCQAVQLNKGGLSAKLNHLTRASSSELQDAFVEAMGAGDAESMNTIIKLVDETLLPGLTNAVTNTQNTLDTLFGKIEACKAKDTACDAELVTLQGASNAAKKASDDAAAKASTDASFTPSCPAVTFTADGSATSTAAISAYTTAIKAAESKYAASKADADSKLTAYNTAFAAYNTKKGACEAACEACAKDDVDAYNLAKSAAEAALPGQKLDFQTYHLLRCIATESKGTNSAEALKACRDNPADPKDIKYTYKTVPAIECKDLGSDIPVDKKCSAAADAYCQGSPCIDLREADAHHHLMWVVRSGVARVDGEAGGLGAGDSRFWDCTCSGTCDGLVGTWNCPDFYDNTIKISADYADDFTAARTNDHVEICRTAKTYKQCEAGAKALCKAFPCVDLREATAHHHPMWLVSPGAARVDGEAGGLGAGDSRFWDCTCSGTCDGLVGTWNCPGFYDNTIKISADYADDFTAARTTDWIQVCG